MNRYRFDNSLDAKGKEKHLHILDEKPLIGNTTALKIVAKVLTWWASGCAVAELGWIKPLTPWSKPKPTKAQIEQNAKDRLIAAETHMRRIALMAADNAPEQYLALLDKAYAAHSKTLDKKADKGTDMHAELEKYVKFCIANNEGMPVSAEIATSSFLPVQIFQAWAVKNIKRFIASEGHSFSEVLWIGCILDVLYEDMQDRLVILDFKSSKEAYDTSFWQCAGIDIAISENGVLDKDGNLMYKVEKPVSYYAVLPFGMENPEPMFDFDTEAGKEAYRAAVVLYKKRLEKEAKNQQNKQ